MKEKDIKAIRKELILERMLIMIHSFELGTALIFLCVALLTAVGAI